MAKKKCWSYKTGEKGTNRVRAFEQAEGGIIYLGWFDNRPGRDAKRRRISTGHRDREQAKRQAEELAVELGKMPLPSDKPEDVTLRQLFDIYLDEKTPDKGPSKQAHDQRASRLFRSFLGDDTKVMSLSRRDWDKFIRRRSEGTLTSKGTGSRPVGNRQVAYDLKFLRAVLNWASKEHGGDLIPRNPTSGFKLPKEASPRRPVLSENRYRAMLRVAEEVDWRFRVALVLANETGHRMKSIRHLRWQDVDLDRGSVKWRREGDKLNREHVTPLSEAAIDLLQRVAVEKPAAGTSWILPSPTDPQSPCSRHLTRDWWNRAEKLADLDHVKGMGWHSLRRKFATERRHGPLKDLCGLGGWKSHHTVLTCYQHPDLEAMRETLEDRRTMAA